MTGEMRALLDRARKGDEDACGELVVRNSGLIWAVVRRYCGRGVEPEDLYQLGCLGFLKAVRGFDSGYGTEFSTYAVPKIGGEIRRFLRDDGAIKVGRGLKQQFAAVLAARQKLCGQLGREPGVSEIAAETGLTAEEIAAAELAAAAPESLQQENADGLPLESLLGTEEPEKKLLQSIALRRAIEGLPEKERAVIALRYYRAYTQQECARVLHVSQVQISRLEKRALEKLRQAIGPAD